MLNTTHDPGRRSWVDAANRPGADFPIQNLPFGVFRLPGSSDPPRIGAAIGDRILDLARAAAAGLFTGAAADAASRCRGDTLNGLMALGPGHWSALRGRMSALLAADAASRGDERRRTGECLVPLQEAHLERPVAIGDYSDFYASIFHATNVGRLFRPDNPLLPNYKYVPIGYHGRASSVVVSGTPVRRPRGQTRQEGREAPVVGPSARLDYELEVGWFVGPGNRLGEPLSMSDAVGQIFGMCLVNDWSARDVQQWEYQPLGPFLAKSFLTTISPWVVTAEALEPFRVPALARPPGDPPPLPYLYSEEDQARGAVDLTLEVLLQTAAMRDAGSPPAALSRGNFRDMYWTPAQMLVHHASNGCNLRPGDLLASGTVSGAQPASRGCLLEITRGGREPVALPGGETRRFLEDGDEVILRGWCAREGFVRIGFGECRGLVEGAVA